MPYEAVLRWPMLAMLVLAAVLDVTSRRIPNWLTAPMALVGLAWSFWPQSGLTPWLALAGLGVGLGLGLVMFVLGAMRGGDAKLLAAVGAWVGPLGALKVFAAAAIVGLVVAVIQAAWQGRLMALLRNVWTLTLGMLWIRLLGRRTLQEIGQGYRSVGRPLPYAVPVLIAAAAVVCVPQLAGDWW
jgi:prepilin peptidase CpaA